MSKHSPSPWEVTPDLDAFGCYVLINQLSPDDEDCDEGNAALMEAAPTMLAALEGLVRWIREPWGEDDGPENDLVVSDACAAIALATGKEK